MSLLALLLVAGVSSTDEERTVERKLPLVAQQRLTIEHAQGDLRIMPIPPDGTAHAELRLISSGGGSEAERDFLRQFDVQIERDEDGLWTLRTMFPAPESKPVETSYAAHLRVWLPDLATLTIEHKYGPLSLQSLNAKQLSASNHLGAIVADDLTGDVTLETRHDDVTARRIRGSLHVDAQSEQVLIEDVVGDVEASNQFGVVHVRDVRGNVRITNRAAPTEVTKVEGTLHVTAPFGDVHATHVDQDVTLHGNNATVTLADVGGTATVEHRHSTLDVRRIQRNLDVTGDFLPLTALGITGDVTVRTTTSSVDLRDVGGDVDIEATAGAITLRETRKNVRAIGQGALMEVRLSSNQPRTVTLEHRAGPLELHLTDDVPCALTARSTLGVIDSEFPALSRRGEGRAATGHLRRGDGSVTIDLTCVGHSIQIRRTPPPSDDDERAPERPPEERPDDRP